jgi:hypothetical protein
MLLVCLSQPALVCGAGRPIDGLALPGLRSVCTAPVLLCEVQCLLVMPQMNIRGAAHSHPDSLQPCKLEHTTALYTSPRAPVST